MKTGVMAKSKRMDNMDRKYKHFVEETIISRCVDCPYVLIPQPHRDGWYCRDVRDENRDFMRIPEGELQGSPFPEFCPFDDITMKEWDDHLKKGMLRGEIKELREQLDQAEAQREYLDEKLTGMD